VITSTAEAGVDVHDTVVAVRMMDVLNGEKATPHISWPEIEVAFVIDASSTDVQMGRGRRVVGRVPAGGR